MVESGPPERIEVSQYRLTAHLALALLIYAATLWVALGLLESPHPNPPPQAREGARRATMMNPPSLAGEGRVGAGWRRAAEAVIGPFGFTVRPGRVVLRL